MDRHPLEPMTLARPCMPPGAGIPGRMEYDALRTTLPTLRGEHGGTGTSDPGLSTPTMGDAPGTGSVKTEPTYWGRLHLSRSPA